MAQIERTEIKQYTGVYKDILFTLKDIEKTNESHFWIRPWVAFTETSEGPVLDLYHLRLWAVSSLQLHWPHCERGVAEILLQIGSRCCFITWDSFSWVSFWDVQLRLKYSSVGMNKTIKCGLYAFIWWLYNTDWITLVSCVTLFLWVLLRPRLMSTETYQRLCLGRLWQFWYIIDHRIIN